ncbi:MAG: hypothetical protein R3260_16050 [Pseudomonas sp.]|nr:hypothetical protein [Pseudomonas sp.]
MSDTLKVSPGALRKTKKRVAQKKQTPPPKREPKAQQPDPALEVTARAVLATSQAANSMQAIAAQFAETAQAFTKPREEPKPKPTRLVINRDQRGLIETIDVIPKP